MADKMRAVGKPCLTLLTKELSNIMSPVLTILIDIKGGTGPASSLFINTIAKPKPKGSQALVKVKAFGLNRMDLLQREGMYPLPPQAGPILGVEFSGTIESFGNEPERGFKEGDEVFGLAYGGQ